MSLLREIFCTVFQKYSLPLTGSNRRFFRAKNETCFVVRRSKSIASTQQVSVKCITSPMSTFSLRMSTFTEVMFTFYAATHLIRLFRKITSNTGRIGLTRCAIFWLRYHQPVCSSSYASASKKPMHSSYALTDERGAPTVCLCLRYGNVSSPCGWHSFYSCTGYDSHICQILRGRLSHIHGNHRCETL